VKEKLNEAIILLGRAYRESDEKGKALVEQAIRKLREDGVGESKVILSKASEVSDDKEPFYELGVPWFDYWFGGGTRLQEMVMVAALPGVGKTHFMRWMSANFLLTGAKVLDIIGEDLQGDIKEMYRPVLNSHDELFENLLLADMQNTRFGIEEIDDLLSRKDDQGNLVFQPDVAVLDHIDILQGRGGQDWIAAGAQARGLKLLAKKHNIIFIVGSQAIEYFSRQGSRRLELYRSHIGKRLSADIVFFIDRISGTEYQLIRDKARGRKINPFDTTQPIIFNMDKMEVTPR